MVRCVAPRIGGGGRQRLIGMYVSAVANLQPPRPPCCMLHVHAGDAVPGELLKLQHSPTPSRARNPRAMRVDVVAVLRARPRWSCLGLAVHPLLPLCTLVLRKQQRCWLVNPSAVFLWCLVACEMRVAVSQKACRLGSGRPQVCCANRAPMYRVSMSCVGSAVRRLLKTIYLSDLLSPPAPPLYAHTRPCPGVKEAHTIRHLACQCPTCSPS
jgi:hypothetical protein